MKTIELNFGITNRIKDWDEKRSNDRDLQRPSIQRSLAQMRVGRIIWR